MLLWTWLTAKSIRLESGNHIRLTLLAKPVFTWVWQTSRPKLLAGMIARSKTFGSGNHARPVPKFDIIDRLTTLGFGMIP